MNQEEKLQTLENFARKKGMSFYSCSEKKYNIPNLNQRFRASRYVIFDLQSEIEGLYFIFYDSSTGYRGSYSIYCGLFKEISDFKSNVQIVRRDWLDKLSFKKRYLSGDRYLDNNITIYAKPSNIDSSILSRDKLNEFVSLSNSIKPLCLETKLESMNIVPYLDGKNLISLTTSYWELDEQKLQGFINIGSDFLRGIGRYRNK